jgi:hypothetical protein
LALAITAADAALAPQTIRTTPQENVRLGKQVPVDAASGSHHHGDRIRAAHDVLAASYNLKMPW